MGRVRDAKNKESARTLGTQMQRRRLLLEVRQEAKEFTEGISTSTDPADAVQAVLDHIFAAYQYATEQMFSLEESEYWRETLGGKVPHEWIREQERLALQVVHIAGKAAGMGLAERIVRIKEGQAALFAMLVDGVLKEMGMPSDQRQLAHEKIATRLEATWDTEGTVEEIAA